MPSSPRITGKKEKFFIKLKILNPFISYETFFIVTALDATRALKKLFNGSDALDGWAIVDIHKI